MDRIGSRMLYKFMRIKCYRVAGFIFLMLTMVFVIDISGVLRHMQEKSFDTEFSYPLESPDFIEIVNAFRKGGNIAIPPINNLYSSIPIETFPVKNCSEEGHIPLIILVKSAPANSKLRQAIRETWKVAALESSAKTVFFVGKPQIDEDDEEEVLIRALDDESNFYKDIVRLDFEDSYYNNTIKTMLEMRWAVEKCSSFDYALFVDDDYYVSIKNIFLFVTNPFEYPPTENSIKRTNQVNQLYAGYRMHPPPHRHKILTKWFVPLDEYPYDYFPPYVTAGAILLSKAALFDIYYASFYTAHFRFDDIYVAICAKKMNITPINSNYFRFWTTRDESPEEYLIASHGFSDSERLHRFWESQKSHGYC
ncbi:unnamed protein product [Orchesella dallaii]|uniref:Hexosyltransferase n=1 Tax=Orchesella dallaii TaxID=48710 RepID=A0ABP1RC21_9HEXA